jgi:hypothetical protein
MRKSKVAGHNPSCGIANVSVAAKEKWGTRQSAQTRIGGFAGTMAMEQLSFLPSRGNRSSTGECGLDRDFVSWPYSLSRTKPPALSVRNSRPSQTARRTGHPRLLVVLKHQNPGHPPAPISSIKELGALPSVPVFQTVNWL